jgi:FlaA1/EpsC-like NDP-sugar epimerase
VQLVLQAAAIGQPGGVYVLDMGQPIKLVDLARNVIRLSGHVPDEEISITFTGLRPGEKLSESLVGDDEVVEMSPVDKILQVRARRGVASRLVAAELTRLVQIAATGDADAVLRAIGRMVPAFRSTAAVNGSMSEDGAPLARITPVLPAAPSIPPPLPSAQPARAARARGMSG